MFHSMDMILCPVLLGMVRRRPGHLECCVRTIDALVTFFSPLNVIQKVLHTTERFMVQLSDRTLAMQ